MRKDNLSSPDSSEVSISTIKRIFTEIGFDKLEHRTNQQRRVTKKNKVIPERSEHLDFKELEPFSMDCPVAGVFFFIPYILEVVRECHLTYFKLFINMPRRVIYIDGVFQIKIRKRAHTPILMGVKKLAHLFRDPWLNNLPIEIAWTA